MNNPNNVKVLIKKLREDAVIPKYAKPGDAGFDFHAVEDITVPPCTAVVVPTGLSMAIPEGFELQIRPRSGFSLQKQAIVANSPGTVDSGYRGEIGVILRNVGLGGYVVIKKGERIAQGVIAPVYEASFHEVDELPESERGSDGFGSTGE